MGVKINLHSWETSFAINWMKYSISKPHCAIMAFKVIKLEQSVLRNIISDHHYNLIYCMSGNMFSNLARSNLKTNIIYQYFYVFFFFVTHLR